MEKFHAHNIDTTTKLANYELNWRQQTTELGSSSVPQPPPQPTNVDNEENSADDNDKDPEGEAKP